MQAHVRILAGVAAFTVLTSCQPPSFTMIVTGTVNALTITARDDGVWPLGWGMDEIYAEEISVTQGGNDVWKMTRQPVDMAGCRSAEQHDPFPFVITRPPPCWQQNHPGALIVPGVTYMLEAVGSMRQGNGYFRIKNGRPVNLDWEGKPVG